MLKPHIMRLPARRSPAFGPLPLRRLPALRAESFARRIAERYAPGGEEVYPEAWLVLREEAEREAVQAVGGLRLTQLTLRLLLQFNQYLTTGARPAPVEWNTLTRNLASCLTLLETRDGAAYREAEGVLARLEALPAAAQPSPEARALGREVRKTLERRISELESRERELRAGPFAPLPADAGRGPLEGAPRRTEPEGRGANRPHSPPAPAAGGPLARALERAYARSPQEREVRRGSAGWSTRPEEGPLALRRTEGGREARPGPGTPPLPQEEAERAARRISAGWSAHPEAGPSELRRAEGGREDPAGRGALPLPRAGVGAAPSPADRPFSYRAPGGANEKTAESAPRPPVVARSGPTGRTYGQSGWAAGRWNLLSPPPPPGVGGWGPANPAKGRRDAEAARMGTPVSRAVRALELGRAIQARGGVIPRRPAAAAGPGAAERRERLLRAILAGDGAERESVWRLLSEQVELVERRTAPAASLIPAGAPPDGSLPTPALLRTEPTKGSAGPSREARLAGLIRRSTEEEFTRILRTLEGWSGGEPAPSAQNSRPVESGAARERALLETAAPALAWLRAALGGGRLRRQVWLEALEARPVPERVALLALAEESGAFAPQAERPEYLALSGAGEKLALLVTESRRSQLERLIRWTEERREAAGPAPEEIPPKRPSALVRFLQETRRERVGRPGGPAEGQGGWAALGGGLTLWTSRSNPAGGGGRPTAGGSAPQAGRRMDPVHDFGPFSPWMREQFFKLSQKFEHTAAFQPEGPSERPTGRRDWVEPGRSDAPGRRPSLPFPAQPGSAAALIPFHPFPGGARAPVTAGPPASVPAPNPRPAPAPARGSGGPAAGAAGGDPGREPVRRPSPGAPGGSPFAPYGLELLTRIADRRGERAPSALRIADRMTAPRGAERALPSGAAPPMPGALPARRGLELQEIRVLSLPVGEGAGRSGQPPAAGRSPSALSGAGTADFLQTAARPAHVGPGERNAPPLPAPGTRLPAAGPLALGRVLPWGERGSAPRAGAFAPPGPGAPARLGTPPPDGQRETEPGRPGAGRAPARRTTPAVSMILAALRGAAKPVGIRPVPGPAVLPPQSTAARLAARASAPGAPAVGRSLFPAYPPLALRRPLGGAAEGETEGLESRPGPRSPFAGDGAPWTPPLRALEPAGGRSGYARSALAPLSARRPAPGPAPGGQGRDASHPPPALELRRPAPATAAAHRASEAAERLWERREEPELQLLRRRSREQQSEVEAQGERISGLQAQVAMQEKLVRQVLGDRKPASEGPEEVRRVAKAVMKELESQLRLERQRRGL